MIVLIKGHVLEINQACKAASINLAGGNRCGLDGSVGGCGLEVLEVLQLGLTVIGGLGTHKACGNHVTILVSHIERSKEQRSAAVVLNEHA